MEISGEAYKPAVPPAANEAAARAANETAAPAGEGRPSAPTDTAPATPTQRLTGLLQSYGYKATEKNLNMLKLMLENAMPLTQENVARMNQAMRLTDSAEKALFLMLNGIRLSSANAAQLDGLVSGGVRITEQIQNLLDSVSQISDPALKTQILRIFSAVQGADASLGVPQPPGPLAGAPPAAGQLWGEGQLPNAANTAQANTAANANPAGDAQANAAANANQTGEVQTNTAANANPAGDAQVNTAANANPAASPTNIAANASLAALPTDMAANTNQTAAAVPAAAGPTALAGQNAAGETPAGSAAGNAGQPGNAGNGTTNGSASAGEGPSSSGAASNGPGASAASASAPAPASAPTAESADSQNRGPAALNSEPNPETLPGRALMEELLGQPREAGPSRARPGGEAPEPLRLSFKLANSTPEDIDRFVNTLRDALRETQRVLTDGRADAPETARVLKQAQTLSEHIDFVSQMKNQWFVQLPVFHNGQEALTALHVYKDGGKKEKHGKSGASSALIALDTASLGRFETYVQKNEQSVSCQFRLRDKTIEQLVRRHVPRLENLLREHHYSLDAFSFLPPGEPYTVLDSPEIFSGEANEDGPGPVYIFDQKV